MIGLIIENLISVDDTGIPKAPKINQIIDKDVFLLYSRDTSKDKKKYLQECGVIYYLADPRSPAKQQGLNDSEALKEAIIQYDLPKDYIPDVLVSKLIKRYYDNAVGPAGIAIENLLRALHTTSVVANKCNELLSNKLAAGVTDQDIPAIIATINNLSSQIKEIPNLQKALNTAKDNLRYEEEQKIARGGISVLSSMKAD